jgi:hypothetical protein
MANLNQPDGMVSGGDLRALTVEDVEGALSVVTVTVSAAELPLVSATDEGIWQVALTGAPEQTNEIDPL